MRKKFPGYYRPTEKEFSELWKDCLFTFDANVLLNLYRYTEDTKNSLLAILEKVSGRIWLPYQAAYEYHNKRVSVIQQQKKTYDDVLEIVRKSRDDLGGKLNNFIRHPYVQIREVLETVSSALVEFEDRLAKLQQEHPDFLIDDPIKETLSRLFNGKVGEPTPEEELVQIYKQGEERYKLRKPPGYEDRQKEGMARYGDLVMWFQLIAKAKENKGSMIFVTDDRKEDWWLKPGGKTIGPRPELVQEISETAGITFYMYSADPFMEYAKKHLKQKVEKKAIDEVREVRQRDEKSATRSDDIIRKINMYLGGEPSAGSMRSDVILKAFEEAARAKLALPNSPTYDLLRKMTEEAERAKFSLTNSSSYDSMRRMFEEAERAKLSLTSSSTYDSIRKMMEEAEGAKLSLMNSSTYDSIRKIIEEAERTKLSLTSETIDGSEGETSDNNETKVEDIPVSDAK